MALAKPWRHNVQRKSCQMGPIGTVFLKKIAEESGARFATSGGLPHCKWQPLMGIAMLGLGKMLGLPMAREEQPSSGL